MFLCFASSPPGRFATTLGDLLPGRFATWMVRCMDISAPEHFATSLDVLPPDDRLANDLTVSQTDGKTFREVAKRPGIKTSKGVKRPDGEPSR